MSDPRAQRTLVKSPPELWAEISDIESLARHLGEFGDIRITRLDPETTVAWEGDRARGTVQLEASGWGTKVTLVAELVESADADPVGSSPSGELPMAAVPELVATPDADCVERPADEVVEAEPAIEPEPEPEPVAAVPAPAPSPAPKQGFFARLFGRKPAPQPDATTLTPVPEPAPRPIRAVPDPVPAIEPTPEPEPIVAVQAASADAELADVDVIVPDEPGADPGELRVGEPVQRTLDHDGAVAVLTSVLDDLGSAHHRPFSRG